MERTAMGSTKLPGLPLCLAGLAVSLGSLARGWVGLLMVSVATFVLLICLRAIVRAKAKRVEA
jgi:hypothetical protein